MEDKLIELLETFNYSVYRQGSVTDYDDTFITFWNNAEYGETYYDNEVLNVSCDFDVNAYSNDPNIVYSLIKEIKKLLESNGWIISDRGHDVGSDEATHVGRGITVIKLFNESEV